MPEVDATLRGLLGIMRMKGIQTILGGCCTRCMLYTVYAVHGVCLYAVYAVCDVCCARFMLYFMSTHDHDKER